MKISPFILHSGVSFRLLYIHMSKVALVLRMVVWAWVNTVRGQLMQSYVALEWLYSCPKLYQSDPPYSTMLIFPCSCCSFSKSIVNFKFISELKQEICAFDFFQTKAIATCDTRTWNSQTICHQDSFLSSISMLVQLISEGTFCNFQ